MKTECGNISTPGGERTPTPEEVAEYDQRLAAAAARAAVVPAHKLSKLTIRRRLRAAGLEAAADAALAENPEVARDWADSVVIMSDDPLLINLLTTIGAVRNVVLAPEGS